MLLLHPAPGAHTTTHHTILHHKHSAKGKAYNRDMRERFALKLKEEKSQSVIAKELCIHPDTVSRWVARANVIRTTEDIDKEDPVVPPAKPRGGPNHVHREFTREHRILLAQLALATRLNLQGLVKYAKEIDDTFPALRVKNDQGDPTKISLSTAHYALKSMGITHSVRRKVDPKQTATQAHTEETRAFLLEQLRSAQPGQIENGPTPEINDEAPRGALHADNLLFLDESNYPLNMTSAKGWSAAGSVLPEWVTKGKTDYISVVACMGLVFMKYHIEI